MGSAGTADGNRLYLGTVCPDGTAVLDGKHIIGGSQQWGKMGGQGADRLLRCLCIADAGGELVL